jgi:TetR/AcrR family transcriptional regulator, regulator of cefoperazone and chloramphenicol sensitivity
MPATRATSRAPTQTAVAPQPDKLRSGPGRPAGGDGAQSRQRLLLAALKLFAAKGFAKTSIREIAQAAGANVAAISYYFGDKESLYRAVFVEPLGRPSDDISLYDQTHFSLRQSLEGFYAGFLRPLKMGELLQQCVRLHFREMIEPTGAWTDELEYGIKPAQKALVRTLCRHLGLSRPDDEVQRLSFAIVGLSVEYFVGRDLIDAVAPRLVNTAAAIDRAVSRLADFAEAMVLAERQRRVSAKPGQGAP